MGWLCHHCRPTVSVALLLLDLFSSRRNQLHLLDTNLVSAAFVGKGNVLFPRPLPILPCLLLIRSFVRSFALSFVGDTRRLLVCVGDREREKGRSFVSLDRREHVDCPALLTFIERILLRERAFTCQCETLNESERLSLTSYLLLSNIEVSNDDFFLSFVERRERRM